MSGPDTPEGRPRTAEDDVSTERALLWTCVHETGHAVVGLSQGYDVTGIRIYGPGQGVTAGIDEANAQVAVAGYCAVGLVLGVDARSANIEADQHHLPDSDVMIAVRAAIEAGCTSDAAIWEHIDRADAEVSELLAGATLAAVAEVGLYLADMKAGRFLTGAALRRETERARTEDSGALASLRSRWSSLS